MIAVLLSLLTLLPCIGIAGSAAGECTHPAGSLTKLYDVAPTCAKGYTVCKCDLCGTEIQTDFTSAVSEHRYLYYQDVSATCVDQGYTLMKCSVCSDIKADPDSYTPTIPHHFTTFSYTEDGTDTFGYQYYKQTKHCDICNMDYTDDRYYKVELVKRVKKGIAESEQPIETCYAKANGTLLYDGTPTLTIEEYPNDKGAWEFAKWTDTDGNNVDITHITKPMKLYASFTKKVALFKVKFLDYRSKAIGDEQIVPYGESATVPDDTDFDTFFVNNHTQYTFEGWNVTQSELQFVTKDMIVEPIYKIETEQVEVNFFNYSRDTLLKTVRCNWGTQISLIAPPKSEMRRDADEDYVYEFNGIWVDIANNIQTYANANSISLYPAYVKSAVTYPLRITVMDGEMPAVGASCQIISSAGNLVNAQFTDSAANVDVKLPKGTYTITCASKDRTKAGDTTYTVSPAINPNKVTVYLQANSTYYESGTPNCSCICHTLFGPVWIKILNLLYSLFKVRYVCCNDMFAVHGSKLKYVS